MSTEPLYSFELSRPLLEAMALFQSKDESRFILNSTQFEINTNGMRVELTLVSTDGRRLAVHRNEIASDNLITGLPESSEFSVDLRGVNKLPKIKGTAGRVVTVAVFEKHAEITSGKHTYKPKFICTPDGVEGPASKFPNWRAILPPGNPQPAACFPVNFKLLADFGKAADLLNEKGSGVIARTYGDGGAISIEFTEYREFYGLLMPLKNEDRSDDKPEWVLDIITEAKPEKITSADLAAATGQNKESAA
jgi:hypothetical protein